MEMASNLQARCRKANFSNTETRLLLEEVGIEKNTLLSCFSNEITNSKKRSYGRRFNDYGSLTFYPNRPHHNCSSGSVCIHIRVFSRPPGKFWSIDYNALMG